MRARKRRPPAKADQENECCVNSPQELGFVLLVGVSARHQQLRERTLGIYPTEPAAVTPQGPMREKARPRALRLGFTSRARGDPPTRHVTFPSARPSEIIYGMAVGDGRKGP